MIHTIRLRGPWNVEPISRYASGDDGPNRSASADLPAAARVTMPADWGQTCGPNFVGRVRYHRIFQTPTGLANGERVFLVVEPPRSCGTVALSNQPLGRVEFGGQPLRADITELLQDHNRLEVVVDHPKLDAADQAVDDVSDGLPGGLVGEVRLEIEE